MNFPRGAGTGRSPTIRWRSPCSSTICRRARRGCASGGVHDRAGPPCRSESRCAPCRPVERRVDLRFVVHCAPDAGRCGVPRIGGRRGDRHVRRAVRRRPRCGRRRDARFRCRAHRAMAPGPSGAVHGAARRLPARQPDVRPGRRRRGRRRLADARGRAAGPRSRLLPRHQPRRSATGGRPSANSSPSTTPRWSIEA